MAYIGQPPFQEFTSIPTKDNFTGDGSTTAFDLAGEVPLGAENALEVFVANVRQEPGTGKAFTLGQDGSGDFKRITFASAPANGAAIYVMYTGIDGRSFTALTQLPQDLDGAELILDGDGDTTITADSDDQIDIKISGADDFQFTANTFTALSGSTIATNTIAETTAASGVTIDSVLLKDGIVTATGFTIGSAAITETELEILDGATVTTTELNLIDGGTARGTDALATGDGILINDGGTMKMTNVDTVRTYMEADSLPLSGGTMSGALVVDSTAQIITNLSSDTQSTPETVAVFGAKYASTGADGAAGSGVRIELKIPDDNTNPITGGGIAAIKENGDDGVSNAALAFYVSQNDTTLDEFMRLESDGDLHAEGDVIAYSTTISDATLKYNINPVEFALDKIKQLKGVTFNYLKGDKASAGLLAQDVEKVMPSAVTEKKLPLYTKDDKTYKTLHYDSMTAILVEAIKELTAKVEKLENK